MPALLKRGCWGLSCVIFLLGALCIILTHTTPGTNPPKQLRPPKKYIPTLFESKEEGGNPAGIHPGVHEHHTAEVKPRRLCVPFSLGCGGLPILNHRSWIQDPLNSRPQDRSADRYLQNLGLTTDNCTFSITKKPKLPMGKFSLNTRRFSLPEDEFIKWLKIFPAKLKTQQAPKLSPFLSRLQHLGGAFTSGQKKNKKGRNELFCPSQSQTTAKTRPFGQYTFDFSNINVIKMISRVSMEHLARASPLTPVFTRPHRMNIREVFPQIYSHDDDVYTLWIVPELPKIPFMLELSKLTHHLWEKHMEECRHPHTSTLVDECAQLSTFPGFISIRLTTTCPQFMEFCRARYHTLYHQKYTHSISPYLTHPNMQHCPRSKFTAEQLHRETPVLRCTSRRQTMFCVYKIEDILFKKFRAETTPSVTVSGPRRYVVIPYYITYYITYIKYTLYPYYIESAKTFRCHCEYKIVAETTPCETVFGPRMNVLKLHFIIYLKYTSYSSPLESAKTFECHCEHKIADVSGPHDQFLPGKPQETRVHEECLDKFIQSVCRNYGLEGPVTCLERAGPVTCLKKTQSLKKQWGKHRVYKKRDWLERQGFWSRIFKIHLVVKIPVTTLNRVTRALPIQPFSPPPPSPHPPSSHPKILTPPPHPPNFLKGTREPPTGALPSPPSHIHNF